MKVKLEETGGLAMSFKAKFQACGALVHLKVERRVVNLPTLAGFCLLKLPSMLLLV